MTNIKIQIVPIGNSLKYKTLFTPVCSNTREMEVMTVACIIAVNLGVLNKIELIRLIFHIIIIITKNQQEKKLSIKAETHRTRNRNATRFSSF